jgi:Ca2+-binding EF-hand superfamily protein
LANGQATVREIVRQVATSPEHKRRFLDGSGRGAQSNAVTVLYRHVLGREPDPGGLQAHTEGMASQGIDAVVDAMMTSDEYRAKYGDSMVPGASGLRFCGPATAGGGAARGARRNLRFGEMDANNDGRVAREEWRGSPQSFANHDWNRDGVLSGDEVLPGARARRAQGEEDFEWQRQDQFASWSQAGFDNLDHNKDGRIARGEWHYNVETFDRADRNRDGALSRWEFLDTPVDDDRGDRFDDLDVNRNGRVERNEWHASADAFQWLDRDRNGVLTRTEVVGSQPTPKNDAFANLDFNGDGRLTPNEWHWSRRSFEQLDGNRDGSLNRSEFVPPAQPAR